MFTRNLDVVAVSDVLHHGEAIEEYSDDKPYPSSLLFYQVGGRTLHVVAARNPGTMGCIVVTAYEPSLSVWESNFKNRRKK